MAQFTDNLTRYDAYKNYKFRVKWDGRYVAGISKVGALRRTTEVQNKQDIYGCPPNVNKINPSLHIKKQ